MEVAEANRIALTALRAVLGAAHPFELTIDKKLIRVTPRAPQPVPWPKGPEGIEEAQHGPWPSSLLLDCEWTGGKVTLEMRASFSRGNNRYRGQLALQVVTYPLNREVLWSSIAARILMEEMEKKGARCAVPAIMTLYAREGERDTRRLFASLTQQAREIGLDSITPAAFRMFDIVMSSASVAPEPREAFERVAKAAIVKVPYVVRGEESDVEGTVFFDVRHLPGPAEPAPVPVEASPAAAAPEASTQENVFFQSIELRDFAGFRELKWSNIERLNIIVGANDTGKSHLLKILYTIAQSVKDYTARLDSDRPDWRDVLAEKLIWTFQPPSSRLGDLVRHGGDAAAIFSVLCNENYWFGFINNAGRAGSDIMRLDSEVRPQPGVSALFIPPKEVLTSLDAIARVREQLKRFGFDDTYYDLILALRGEPIQAELPEELQRVLSDLEALFTGRIETEQGRFVFKRGADRFDMPQVAEGIKKIGIFTRLIQNGSLRRNSILFIDEPETNLHPRAARALVDMLYDLSRAGVQIYAATHSYFILKQFEIIARKHKTPVRLCCLSRSPEGIESSFFDLQEGLPPNGIVEEAIRLYDDDVDVTMEDV